MGTFGLKSALTDADIDDGFGFAPGVTVTAGDGDGLPTPPPPPAARRDVRLAELGFWNCGRDVDADECDGFGMAVVRVLCCGTAVLLG